MFEITFSLTNLKVYKYYNRKMSNLVTVSPKFFFNFLSQLEISSIYLFTAGFQLPAALKKAEHGSGPFETQRKDLSLSN